ncbi:MAG: LysR family transcriptional regulator [Hyphomicrobiaceae bacterium]|nr:MAG: LysR family transcriptional regulator [Hyphomicrobiaceae bacterium]
MLRGSVTGAAQSLKVSRPVVSRLIRDRRSALAPRCLSTEDNHLVPTPASEAPAGGGRSLCLRKGRFAGRV